ncbi:MAG: NosD domain-containing protein [Candidatus Bathyarchaeia archaeon]
MKHKKAVLAVLLVAIVVVAFFVAYNLDTPAKQTEAASKPFYLGIETGWNANVSQCEASIDQVKGYTNLYIIASPLILRNETMLNEVCDYAYNAGMYIMPAWYQDLFNTSLGYAPASWFTTAKERYGDKLLGIYFYDEPGGSQLDETINFTSNNAYNETSQPISYQDYANWYFQIWTQGNGVPVAANLTRSLGPSLFTSDYALYWFDYQLGYDTVLAELGWNNSRPLQVSLVRGAAEAQNKSWGAIITWTYDQAPYLETPSQLYNDMVLAYNSGASYIAIYDSSKNYVNTTLTNPEYFTKLKEFWSYVQQNPEKQGNLKANVAVVLPQDYGFGFRNENDSVWQYHAATAWTQQLYNDVTNLLTQYKSGLNIVYSDPQFQGAIKSEYSKILYWPQDFEKGVSYPVTDLNDSLGYSTIQDAVSSFATYEGDTILVDSGTYQGNINVNKTVSLTSQSSGTTTIEGVGNGTALTIAADNVAVTGFTVKNADYPASTVGTGILLENAHGCTVTDNVVAGNYIGVLLNSSTSNVFRGNQINGNTYNLILQNSSPNSIDSSNTVGGKPYTAG